MRCWRAYWLLATAVIESICPHSSVTAQNSPQSTTGLRGGIHLGLGQDGSSQTSGYTSGIVVPVANQRTSYSVFKTKMLSKLARKRASKWRHQVTVDKKAEAGLFEGDIRLTNQQKRQLGLAVPQPRYRGEHNKGDTWRSRTRRRYKRKVTNQLARLWPDATVPYTFDKSLNKVANVHKYITYAMQFWEKHTCVKFVKIEDAKSLARAATLGNFVRFVAGKGCHSGVGMKDGAGEQTVSIGKGCEYEGMIMHELGHVLGFWHEHARIDRDNHVIIMWDNVALGSRHNFDKQEKMDLLAPYDLSSLMQYDMWAFGKDGQKTLQPILSDMEFITGQRKELSFYDILTANRMYKCAAKCPETSPVCENEGFLNKNCACSCPPGLIGSRCQFVKRATGSRCGGVIHVTNVTQFTSPGYPAHYRNRMRCIWLIKGPPGTTLTMKFEDFDLQEGHKTCRDFINLRYYRIGIKQGPSLCGNGTVDKVYQSASNLMMAYFYSNSYTTRKGFNATVTASAKIDCNSSPCLNNGTCIQYDFDYFCKCPHGWIGHQCDIQVVNGSFSAWSDWSTCVGRCGIQQRRRSCDNPAPANGGLSCDGELFQVRRCADAKNCDDYFFCHFGNGDDCGIKQLQSDDFDWILNRKGTPSIRTGPERGHTSQTDDDMYLYLEASHAQKNKQAGFLIPDQRHTGLHCLHFFYHMLGSGMGTLQVFTRDYKGRSKVMWQLSGDQGANWREGSVNLFLASGKQVGFMGTRGTKYDSDIALDDISISPGPCVRNKPKVAESLTSDDSVLSDEKGHKVHGGVTDKHAKSSKGNSNKNDKETALTHGCTSGEGRHHKPGPFSYFYKCRRFNCFCNQDGPIDCPEWMSEGICNEN